MKLEFARHIFEKFPNMKFHENPLCGGRVRADWEIHQRTDGQTGMTKLIVVFRSFANAPKNFYVLLPMTSLNWVLLKLTYNRLVHRWWNPKVPVTAFGSSSFWHLCTLTYVHCSLSRSFLYFLRPLPYVPCAQLSNPWFNISMMDSTDGETPHFTRFFNLVDVCFFGPDIHPSSFFSSHLQFVFCSRGGKLVCTSIQNRV